jgi:type VI secretion system protein ImpL
LRPVYVLVTKTDLLKGFRSYFASLDKTQREQIWGFTFGRSAANSCGNR